MKQQISLMAFGLLVLSSCASPIAPVFPDQLREPALQTRATATAALPDEGTDAEAFQRALGALKTGNAAAAYTLSRTISLRAPDSEPGRRALLLSGRTALSLGRTADAETALLGAAAVYPLLGDYALMLLADHYRELGRNKDAAALYQRLITEHPASLLAGPVLFKRGLALAATSEYAAAAASFRAALEGHPRSEFAPEAALGLGRALAEQRDYAAAARVFLDITVRYPGNSHEQEAEKSLGGLRLLGVEIPKLSPGEQYERARSLHRANFYDKALTAFTTLLEQAPDHPQRADIMLRRGLALFYLGRRQEAASALSKLVQERPEGCRCAEALNWLGKSYSRTGMREDAIRTYHRIVTDFPDSEWADDALYQIGNVYRDANDVTKAVQFYRRLADEYRDSALADSALWWQAWTWYGAQEFVKAREALDAIVRRYPKSFLVNQALYWNGRAAERMGQTARALEYYRNVLARGPYTYYGYRAADRMLAVGLPVITTAADASAGGDLLTAQIEGDAAADSLSDDSPEEDGPPEWTETALRTLSADPTYRKVLELMHQGMNNEAAAELRALQERTPSRHASLVGLSKTFFALGDYHRALVIVLRNFERALERPGKNLADDLWLLAYPQGFWESIAAAAKKNSIDPFFVAAIIREESQFRPEALSPAGARGVMQVMPTTGEWVARTIGLNGFDRSKLFEPETGITVGAWYLRYLMKRFDGNELLVAAAYNAGPEAVAGWIEKNNGIGDADAFVEAIPYTETRGYVKKVLRNYAEYRRVYGKSASPARPDGAFSSLEGKAPVTLLCGAPGASCP